MKNRGAMLFQLTINLKKEDVCRILVKILPILGHIDNTLEHN